VSGAEASVIWTVVAPELILGDDHTGYPAPVEVWKDGRILEVIPGPDGVGTVSRLISANPMDYLNPEWQPGSQVDLVGGR